MSPITPLLPTSLQHIVSFVEILKPQIDFFECRLIFSKGDVTFMCCKVFVKGLFRTAYVCRAFTCRDLAEKIYFDCSKPIVLDKLSCVMIWQKYIFWLLLMSQTRGKVFREISMN